MAINANTKIYDKAIDRAAMIRLYERRVNGKVELVINGHAVRVDKLIKDANFSVVGFEIFREAVDKELAKTFVETASLTKRSLVDLAADQISYGSQNIEVAMNKIWRTEKPVRKIAEDVAKKEKEKTESVDKNVKVTNEYVFKGGDTLVDRWMREVGKNASIYNDFHTVDTQSYTSPSTAKR